MRKQNRGFGVALWLMAALLISAPLAIGGPFTSIGIVKGNGKVGVPIQPENTLGTSSTLHVGDGAGSDCAIGCGGDPNEIEGLHVSIYQNSNGAEVTNPILLILGIPNNATAFPDPPILTPGGVWSYNPYDTAYPNDGVEGSWSWADGGADEYGLKVPSGTPPAPGYYGLWDSTSTAKNVYEFLGLKGNSSNNLPNWIGFLDTDLGITATNFGIYVFRIDADLGPKGLVDVTFNSGALPIGTYIVAYGEDGESRYVTPFTEAGGITDQPPPPVPEPASVILVGSGMIGLAGFLRRRENKGRTSV